jgi:F5/8 type C domain
MKPVPIAVVGLLAPAGCSGRTDSPTDATRASATLNARLKIILVAAVAFFALGCASAQAQDMALNKPASASSTENNRTDLRPELANDGNSSTRWSSSFVDNQWWEVDLGSVRQINRVELNWETAYSSRYSIRTRASSGDSWSTAATVTISSPGLTVHTFSARNARYVRIQGDQRATAWGISLWDVRVFGPSSSPSPPDGDGDGVPDSIDQVTPSPQTGFPNALNTGVPLGTTLEPHNGNLTVNTPGSVISDRLINGCVTVNAANVTIRRSKVVCSGPSAIWSGSTGLLVEDTEVDCNNAVGRTAITPQGYTARRVNAHSCENIFWASQNVLIEDSYIHDPIEYDRVRDPHTDSIQMPAGASNITIDHNTVYGGYVNQSNFGNSAIGGHRLPMSNITINNNLVAGGGYTVYCPQGAGTNYRFTNNRFSRIFVSTVGGFGPWLDCKDEPVVSGNVYHESGSPL